MRMQGQSRQVVQRMHDRIIEGEYRGARGYQLDELYICLNDAQRILIVRDLKSGYETALRFTPLEYAVLVPLLEHYERPVAADTLYQAAFATSWAPRDDRRLYRHIDRMRPKLSPVGIVIRSVAHHGYVLLKAPIDDDV